jgi:hypothetical protein
MLLRKSHSSASLLFLTFFRSGPLSNTVYSANYTSNSNRFRQRKRLDVKPRKRLKQRHDSKTSNKIAKSGKESMEPERAKWPPWNKVSHSPPSPRIAVPTRLSA